MQLPDWFMILHSSSRDLCTYMYYVRPNIFGETRKKEPPPGSQVSGWTCRICVHIFRIYLVSLKTPYLDFCAQNMCNRCSYVVPGSFSMGVICDLIMALGSQIFETLRKKQCRHALEYTSYRLGLKKWRGKVVFLRKRLTMVDLFEGLWSVGTRCRH